MVGKTIRKKVKTWVRNGEEEAARKEGDGGKEGGSNRKQKR